MPNKKKTEQSDNGPSPEDRSSSMPKVKNPELQAIIDRIDKNIVSKFPDTPPGMAAEIFSQVMPDGQEPPEQLWMSFCPMPTDLCRVSPFFPLHQKDVNVAKRPFISDMVITSSSWGSIKFTGPKLSVFEEDVLMAVLALLDQAGRRSVTNVGGQTTYAYRGPLLPLLKVMGLSSGSANYNRFRRALELLHSSVIKMEIYKRDTKGKRKIGNWYVSNILSAAKWDDKAKELYVIVNPHFYECYAAGNVTLISTIQRSRLKSPISKALHRFVMSHRDRSWKGHFLTLASSLNLNEDQPKKERKRYIVRAVNELVKNNILDPKSGFVFENKEVVCLAKHDSFALKSRK
ncbi:MAG: hypothetical protein COS92_03555 [Desulfobacterales bacterium CG07_land_8_20_14_0_80_52_14]|nr:MAG: hypothetical protein COS92_03555 [Desulfobacterales bacterium CG07_land_8_20_14_0_80_52_14]PJB37255.1 MAG: hypothetical protein CO107_05345 [Deltaproteobacteria bacterium CG_4_9_14_3_um_filter_51_14]